MSSSLSDISKVQGAGTPVVKVRSPLGGLITVFEFSRETWREPEHAANAVARGLQEAGYDVNITAWGPVSTTTYEIT